MGWKVVGVAAVAACCTVFLLGSASASGPPGPTSATKALGVIKQTATARPGLRAAAPVTTTTSGSTPSNYAIDPTLQLTYHGGPVMHTHTLYVIYWQPSGFNFGADGTASTTYENLINQYVQDVAADSGKTSNAYGTISQYHDGTGAAQYNVTYGGSFVDTNAFPGSHVSPDCPLNNPHGTDLTSFICLTDQDLITEIDAVVSAQWPSAGGLNSQFALVLPDTVKTCTDSSNAVCSDNFFCAYHSAYNHAPSDTTPFIYLNLPYEPDSSCHNDFTTTQPEPNAPSNADTLIDDMSHEEREAATDPLGNAWFDSAGNEADDKCIDTYGSVLGPANTGNQLINGDTYDTQTEWSNLKKGCYQMGAPTVTLGSTSAAAGDTIDITGTNFFTSSPNKPVVKFNTVTLDPSAIDVVSPTHLIVTIPSGNVNGKVTVQAIGGTGTSTNTFGLTPHIDSLDDSHDFTGTKITITGTGFFGVTSVKFGTVPGVFSSVAADGTSLKVVVPAAAVTTGNLNVTAAGGTSNGADFTVTPKITSFTPAKATALANVTITGTGLAGASDVQFGGVSAAGVSMDTATKIVAQVPTGAVSGVISVVNGADTANSALSFTPLPKVSSLDVVDGKAGNTVTITGGVLAGVTQVKFGTVLSPLVTPVSATEVQAVVPSAPFSTGKVTVIAGSATAVSTQTYSITKITSISPLSAPAGAMVTITGQGLGSTTSVDFNNHPAATLSGSPTATSVKVIVPGDATDGALIVYTPNIDILGMNTPKPFKPLPRIVSFDHATYQAGDPVTVTGTNLHLIASPTLSGKLGAVAITPIVDGPTQFHFTIPSNAVTGTVSFTDGAGSTVSTAKVNVVPTISGGQPNPNEAAPGAKIVFSGATFTGTKSVTFGADTHGAPFVVSNLGQTLTVTVPATGTSGKITITNAGGSTQTASDFTLDPVIKSFTPVSAPVGATITVTGAGLTGAEGVMFNGDGGDVGAVPTNVTATGFKVVVPQGAITGTLAVETSTGGVDAYSAASATTLTVTATLASFSPAGGVPGTVVTITGAGFTGATGVSFGTTPATTFAVDSDTQITATVPDGAADGAIKVTRPTAPTLLQSPTSFLVPTITALSPSTVTTGDDLEIDGTHLDGATKVTFQNGAFATPFSTSASVVHVHVPAGAGSGHVTVTTKFGNDVTSSASVTVQYTIAIVVSGGTAADEVTANVGGIACFGDGSGTCMATLEAGTSVILTAIPGGGDIFVWWNGGPFFEVGGNPASPFTMSDNYTATSSLGAIHAVFGT